MTETSILNNELGFITPIIHVENVYEYVNKMTLGERLIEVTRVCFVPEAYRLS